MTSLPIKILISTAAAAGIYALFLDSQKQKRIRQLVARVKEHGGGHWTSLPWLHRAMPRVGLNILFRSSAIQDPESLALYSALRAVERKQMAALAACALAIGAVVLGTKAWGWTW